MNIIKSIVFTLFLALSTTIFAQNTLELNCENGVETIETGFESQAIVSYKIVYSRKLYTEESFGFNEGILVISDLYQMDFKMSLK